MAASEETLGKLHNALAKALTDRVNSADSAAADLAVAARFLKDNGITCSPEADNALGELEKALAAKRSRSKVITEQDRADIAKVADVTHLMH